MTSTIDRLSQWLARERPELSPSTLDGASDSRDEALPEALRSWWAWVDPVARAAPAGDEGCFLRDWRLLDRETSAARQREWSRNLEGRAEFDGWWRSAWVPIAERLDCDLLVVDFEGTFDAPGSVVEVPHDAPFRYVRAESFDAWLEGLVRSLEAGEWELYDDGLWWDDPDSYAWDRFGASEKVPYRVELNVEREPVEAPSSSWIDAWSERVSEAAREARWASVPFGWQSLRWRAGADLDDTLALVKDAPGARYAIELARLASTLSSVGDARAEALATRLLSQPAAALVSAVAHLDLASSTLRAALVAHAVAQAAARARGAAALCASVAASVSAHDVEAARDLRWWSARLRPTADTRFVTSVMQALAAARASDPSATAQVDAILAEETRLYDLDAHVAEALVAACHSVGRWPAALVARWNLPCSEALVAVRTLTALGARDEARRIVDASTDRDWRAALLVAHAAGLPEGDPRGEGVLAEAEGLVSPLRELLWTVGGDRSDVAREVRFDHASMLLRRGARGETLTLLDAWWRAGRESVAVSAERLRALLDDPSARHGAPWRAPSPQEFDAMASSWKPSQIRQESTRRLLRCAVALADGEEAPRGRAVLDAIEAAARASGPTPWRYADTIALALVAYGRIDDALAITADPWWRSDEKVFVALVARLVAGGRGDDALTLGRDLVRSRDYEGLIAVAPAVAIVDPGALPAMRATCDALATERRDG